MHFTYFHSKKLKIIYFHYKKLEYWLLHNFFFSTEPRGVCK